MPARHHNIFGYYRGPSTRGAAEEGRVHRQVENNTTKALINVLEHGGHEILRSFLERFVPEAAPLVRAAGNRFYLQSGPQDAGLTPRWLLAISPRGEIAPSSFTATVDAESRIDAAIQPGGGGLVVVEVKTAGELDGAQLSRHASMWSVDEVVTTGDHEPSLPDSWRLISWPHVWRWARHQSERDQDPVSLFLLSQLVEYLAILGLAPWGGFRAEDFEISAADAYEQRVIAKYRLAGLWDGVLRRLDRDQRVALGSVTVGRIGSEADHVVARTNRGQTCVKFSLELHPTELQLNVVAWEARPAARLEAWVTTRQRPPIGLELVVYERRASGAGRRSNWNQAAMNTAAARFSVEGLASGEFTLWREQWLGQHDRAESALAYHLRRTWSRHEVLGRGEGIADEIAHDVRSLLPLVRELNRRG